MKAEIQVRTLLEHAWAGFTHDKAYKGAFAVPVKWQRELAGLAAILEEADQAFSRIQAGLQIYAASYSAYMTEEQMREEIEVLQTVLACDPENAQVAHRIGKLAMTLGDWQKAIDVFSPYVKSGYQPILRDLGVAICKVHCDEPTGSRYREGQKYLEAASAPPYRDADALASLAGTWKALDEERARALYRQAFEVDPSDPYAVSNYLVYEIAYRRDTTAVSLMAPAIGAALQRCRDQVDVGMNLPWAFYNLGIFYLLLGKLYESLAAYATAIQVSNNDWMIETSLRLLDRLSVVRNALQGYDWTRELLLIGCAVKFPGNTSSDQVMKLASAGFAPIRGPVVIVSGGCDSAVEPELRSYRDLVLEAFRDFRGTIISGGTTAGISGWVGEVQHAYPDTIRTIGYVPKLTPADVSTDKRYSEIRHTEGHDFSAQEPLQYWIDLLASGIQPSQVRLLGINGGAIAAAEYRIALALGARVAVIESSGRAATQLIADVDWGSSKLLLRLPADAMTVRAFVGLGSPKLESEQRVIVARAIHDAYRDSQASRLSSQDSSLAEWDNLLGYLRDSNLQQADHIAEKLRQIGCTIQQIEGREIVLLAFADNEIEIMAEMEHGRWVVERLLDGWTWAKERDVTKKTSPYLVPWSELPDNMKGWDRETVRKIPAFLAKVGLEIQRKEVGHGS
jgi:tetratricopeptide (TPR) repeat protein